MPVCVKCQKMQPTAEVRDNPTGPVCFDKYECLARKNSGYAEKQAAKREEIKRLKELLR